MTVRRSIYRLFIYIYNTFWHNAVVVIGFDSPMYYVNECNGNVTFGVEVKNGTLQTELIVFVSAVDLSGESTL